MTGAVFRDAGFFLGNPMQLSIDVTMQYRFADPDDVILVLEVAEYPGQTVTRSDLEFGDAEVTRIAGDGGIGSRIIARLPGAELNLRYGASVEVTRSPPDLSTLQADPLHQIPAEASPYLRPSLYCPSEKLGAFVARRFGHVAGGAKVAAMCDWIEAEMSYVPGASDADTDALDTFVAREGVCRDYVHLLCAFVRAAGIPARAVAAYGPDVTPPDFHAVTEVWLDGAWHLVDCTGMCSPDSLAVIAVGRDACDIALLESRCAAELVTQEVSASRS
jgi:transglutaminase-like putative cysteine protease